MCVCVCETPSRILLAGIFVAALFNITIHLQIFGAFIWVLYTQSPPVKSLRSQVLTDRKGSSSGCSGRVGGWGGIEKHEIYAVVFSSHFYRPQRSWGKVIFSEAWVKSSVHKGGGVWLERVVRGRRGVCGGCGCGRGACMVGACVAGGMHDRGCKWQGGYARRMVNERAVRILLEYILVFTYFYRVGGGGGTGPLPLDPILGR